MTHSLSISFIISHNFVPLFVKNGLWNSKSVYWFQYNFSKFFHVILNSVFFYYLLFSFDMFFKIVPCFQLTVGLDKSRRCVRDVLEMMNCTNCRTSLFFNKYAHEHTFSVYWVRETILRNKTYIYLWSVCQILKINNEICFMSHLTILKLIIVSKINLQWNCLPTFPYPPSQTT